MEARQSAGVGHQFGKGGGYGFEAVDLGGRKLADICRCGLSDVGAYVEGHFDVFEPISFIDIQEQVGPMGQTVAKYAKTGDTLDRLFGGSYDGKHQFLLWGGGGSKQNAKCA